MNGSSSAVSVLFKFIVFVIVVPAELGTVIGRACGTPLITESKLVVRLAGGGGLLL